MSKENEMVEVVLESITKGKVIYGEKDRGLINPNDSPELIKWNNQNELDLLKAILALTPQTKSNTDVLMLLHTGIAARERKLPPKKAGA